MSVSSAFNTIPRPVLSLYSKKLLDCELVCIVSTVNAIDNLLAEKLLFKYLILSASSNSNTLLDCQSLLL